jgi:hypothetical protein
MSTQKWAVVILLAGLCLTTVGCWPFMPYTRSDSGSVAGEYRAWSSEPTTGVRTWTEKKLTIEGPSGKTSQEGGAQAIKTGSLNFELDGMVYKSPKQGISAEGWEGTLANPVAIMSIIGGIALIVAAVYWWFTKDTRTALFIGGGGLGLLACALVYEKYPWVILFLFLGGVGYGIWTLVTAIKKKKAEAKAKETASTLGVVVKAVEDSDNPASVKERVAVLAGVNADKVTETIRETKKAVGL